ncbi:MAG: hypothetical protein HY911_09445 [Desulfobacterales bacterium]|nr:hypothetical protein [Desulfobacterales bacterium]
MHATEEDEMGSGHGDVDDDRHAGLDRLRLRRGFRSGGMRRFETQTDADAGACTDSAAVPHPEPHGDAAAYPDSNAGSDANADTSANSCANAHGYPNSHTDCDPSPNTCAHAAPHAGTDSHTDAHTLGRDHHRSSRHAAGRDPG